MRLDIKATAVTFALLWGVFAMLLTGLANLIWPGYGQALLDVMASIYPGYQATPNVGQVLIGTLYGLLDGAVGGAVVAWLYNTCAARFGRPTISFQGQGLVSEGSSVNVQTRLKESDSVLLWVQARLDGLKVQSLPDDRRTQLAGGCWHVAIEHAQAIVVLVHERLEGSALAFIRPLFEAYVRGLWLMHAATDDQVDDAGKDRFPNNFGKLISDLEQPGRLPPNTLSDVKTHCWTGLCSLTHTGYQQIGARLTPEGLGWNYEESQILGALGWADAVALMSMIAFANVADNQQLAIAALERLRVPAR